MSWLMTYARIGLVNKLTQEITKALVVALGEVMVVVRLG